MIQVPGYLIKREIGKGGMATVYLAVQASLDREVALKVMQPTLANDPNFSRRFLQEARTLASLTHPNIVAVYDVGVTEAQLHYFSMQHLPGGDFAHRIKDGVSEFEVVRVLAGVARALGFAHQRGFVHRDVSPANVLFDASGNPVLTDFGIARAVARTSRLTNAGVSVGTSHYMSPEQARGADVDARSDIYSLGCVAYEALTGKAPYTGEDGFAIAYAHVFEPIPRLPPKLAHWQMLVDRALAKSAGDRFANLDEFIEELARVGTLPSEAKPQADVLDDSDFIGLVADASRANKIPAELLGAIPPPAGAGAAAAAVAAMPAPAHASQPTPRPEPRVASKPRAPLPRRAIAVGALALALVVLVLYGLTRPPSPSRAAASVERSAPDRSPSAPPVPTPAPASTDAAPIMASGAEPPTAAALLDPAVPTTTDAGTPDATALDATTLEATGLDASLDPSLSPGLVAPDAIAPNPEEAEALKTALATTAVDPIALLLALGQSDLAAQRYAQPPGRNALERYQLAATLAERHRAKRELDRARQGVADVASGYVELAEKRLGEGNEREFLDYLARAETIAATVPQGAAPAQRVRDRRARLRDEAIAAGKTATTKWEQRAAIAAYERALTFDPGSREAQRGLATAKRIGETGYVFRDGNAPELVIASSGARKLAVARTEITVAEFKRYWQSRGRARGGSRPACRDRESFFRGGSKNRTFESPGFAQAASHPVVCVSWDDAADYARWLSEQTGKRYRLPTGAEWSAFARGAAGATNCRANVADARYRKAYDEKDAFGCDDGHAETGPVASYDAAPAGVYDAVGNVREWLGDCAQGCREHSAIGTAWFSAKDKTDVGQRASLGNDVASNTVGFRVVRELD